jgi:hypothetical protein
MSLHRRLDKLAGRLPADPNAPPRFLVVAEDADGRWWEWDEDPPTKIDPAAVDPKTRVIIISERPDGPQ